MGKSDSLKGPLKTMASDPQIQGASKKHHVVPRAYLKGFATKDDSNLIWLYRKGWPYKPGTSNTSNPQLTSVRQAGWLQEFYSFDKADGTRDFDSVEKAMNDKFEGRGHYILELLKNYGGLTYKSRKPFRLSPRQKAVLASYIILMLRRTPRAKERSKHLWKNPPPGSEFAKGKDALLGLRSYLIGNPALRDHPLDACIVAFQNHLLSTDAPDSRAKIAVLAHIRHAIRGHAVVDGNYWVSETERIARGEVPDEMRVKGIVEHGQFGKWIRRMHWVYLIAPPGCNFFTCDHPVFMTENIGLVHTDGEFTFPISSSLALYGTWHTDVHEGYTVASAAILGEINKRTIANATNWVFCCYESPTVANLVSNPRREGPTIYHLLMN